MLTKIVGTQGGGGPGILVRRARGALAAQLVEAGADRLEIVGCSRATHRASISSIGQIRSAPGIVKPKPAGRQTLPGKLRGHCRGRRAWG